MPNPNPNPNRARRSADELLMAVVPPAAAPAAALAVAAAPAVAAPAAAPAAAAPAGIFGIMPVRATGLQQPQPMGNKRTATVVREDVSWQCVEVTDNTDSKNPRWRCRGCHNFYTGGATKVVDHVLGRSRSAKCVGNDADFLGIVDKVETERDETAGLRLSEAAVLRLMA